nr:hypothetical protein [Pedobacter sp. ASV2]
MNLEIIKPRLGIVFYCFSLLIAICSGTKTYAQLTAQSSALLTDKQVSELFPNPVRAKIGIDFPIFRVYKYADKGGQYYCVLTESQDVVNKEKDAFNKISNYKIKAINFKEQNGSLIKTWEINDNTQPNMHGEESIWFWTKYAQFSDFDHDGFIEPIIVYGTQGMNNYDDGRIKFIIFYKGQKIAIRHQNGVLDDERDTAIDKAFYTLPAKLQETIKEKMNLMVKNNHAIFPYGWQKAMQKKKTFFSERGD